VRDPKGYVDGPNLYGYEKNSPVASRDPEGTIVIGFKGYRGSQLVNLGKVFSEPLGEGFADFNSDLVYNVARGATDNGTEQAWDVWEAEELGDALEWLKRTIPTLDTDRLKPPHKEPLYIVGYSIGCRAAQVLANIVEGDQELAKKVDLRWVVFFDYNWGAGCFDSAAWLYDITKPLYSGAGGHFATATYLHYVSMGQGDQGLISRARGAGHGKKHEKMTDHTKEVWDVWRRNKGKGYLSWTSNDRKAVGGVRGLLNTSGYRADVEVPGFPLKRSDFVQVGGDHIDLGFETEGNFGEDVGRKIGEDFRTTYKK
jgi:hypothetical protein